MRVERFGENPLIRPEDVAPAFEGFEVIGAFNAGAFELDGRIGLLVRVAERPLNDDPSMVAVPVLDTGARPAEVKLVRLRRDDPEWDFSDPRVVAPRVGGRGHHHYLTSLSYLRLAWSADGRRFEFDERTRSIRPESDHERFGIEDARVTRIGGLYLITYSAVSEKGICVGLISTTDFRLFARHGVILPPENKDVCLFPAKMDGEYVALHRPAGAWCRPGIWVARSPDLIHWGQHRLVIAPRPGRWDSLRVGGGPPPILTPEGWLAIYHGAGQDGYALGVALLGREDPARVIARSGEPIMTPEADYEKAGFVDNVVFCNGLVERPGGELWLYYGGADRVTAGCRSSVGDLLGALE